MIIQIAPSGLLYSLFYLLAIFSACILQFYEGKKLGFPTFSWLIVILLGKNFFITGTKIVTLTSIDWQYFLQTLSFPENQSNSVLGGFVAFILVFLIVRYIFGYGINFLDALALPFIVSMTIQKIGCFFGGCCFGIPSSLGVGVVYNSTSTEINDQFKNGVLLPSATNSLALHPVQLYLIFACLLILFIFLKIRHKIKAPGNSFLFVGILYLLSRFFVEFLVDPHANNIEIKYFLGLKNIHWGLFLTAVFFLFVLLKREKRFKSKFQIFNHIIPNENHFRNILFFIFYSFYSNNIS